jgi:hypothetical protein
VRAGVWRGGDTMRLNVNCIQSEGKKRLLCSLTCTVPALVRARSQVWKRKERQQEGAYHPRLEHGEKEGGCDAAGHAAEQQDPPVVEVLRCSEARHRYYHKRHKVPHLRHAGQGIYGSVRQAQPLATEAVCGAA